MHVIMGATGHVGSACIDALLDQGQPVLAIVHDAAKAGPLKARGCEVVVADVMDVDALRAALRRGKRAFLLNPPAPPTEDTDAVERASVAAILAALDDPALQSGGLEKVVAASTMGAQAGEALEPRTGDSSILYEFEKGLVAQHIPAAINRAAYYFSNFDMQIDAIRDTGVFDTVFPADFVLPMVAPQDLGRIAAQRLMGGPDDIGVISVEGPERLSFAQVAQVFARVLGREVEVRTAPQDQLIEAFQGMGFSPPAADAYARMTRTAIAHPAEPVDDETVRGQITLEAYLRDTLATAPA